AGPRVNTTVSGDGDIPLGSIIVPLHVNCRPSSANAAMLKKAMISGAIMLTRNIDKAPRISVGRDTTCGLMSYFSMVNSTTHHLREGRCDRPHPTQLQHASQLALALNGEYGRCIAG